MPLLPEGDPAGQETAARHDREAMLAAAGIRAGIPAGIRVSLAYLSGPQASTVKVLESYRTLIGREEGDVVTRDPETSRRHAAIDIHADGTVWLTDLGSTNGTFVDGERVSQVVLQRGHKVAIGGRVLKFEMVDRTDINHLLAMTKSWASFRHSVKIVLRHAMDRLSWPRGTRLVMGSGRSRSPTWLVLSASP